MAEKINTCEEALEMINNNDIHSLKEYIYSQELFDMYEQSNSEYKWLFKQIIDILLSSNNLEFQDACDILWYTRYKSNASKYLLNNFWDDQQSYMQIIWHATWKVRDEAHLRLNEYRKSKWMDIKSLEQDIYSYK